MAMWMRIRIRIKMEWQTVAAAASAASAKEARSTSTKWKIQYLFNATSLAITVYVVTEQLNLPMSILSLSLSFSRSFSFCCRKLKWKMTKKWNCLQLGKVIFHISLAFGYNNIFSLHLKLFAFHTWFLRCAPFFVCFVLVSFWSFSSFLLLFCSRALDLSIRSRSYLSAQCDPCKHWHFLHFISSFLRFDSNIWQEALLC